MLFSKVNVSPTFNVDVPAKNVSDESPRLLKNFFRFIVEPPRSIFLESAPLAELFIVKRVPVVMVLFNV